LAIKYASNPSVCIRNFRYALSDYTGTAYRDSGHLFADGSAFMAKKVVDQLSECRIL
jgi:hypothetical protein